MERCLSSTILKSAIIRPNPKSEHAISGPEYFTLDPRVKSGRGDPYSSLFCVLNRNPRRETFQLARALQKKGGQEFFSRDTRVLFARRGFFRPTAFDARAELLRQREPCREPDPPIADAVSYPQSSYSLPETCASSRE